MSLVDAIINAKTREAFDHTKARIERVLEALVAHVGGIDAAKGRVSYSPAAVGSAATAHLDDDIVWRGQWVPDGGPGDPGTSIRWVEEWGPRCPAVVRETARACFGAEVVPRHLVLVHDSVDGERVSETYEAIVAPSVMLKGRVE